MLKLRARRNLRTTDDLTYLANFRGKTEVQIFVLGVLKVYYHMRLYYHIL